MWDDDLALAHRAAHRAAEVALEYFHRGVSFETKPDGSPVSEADFEVERQVLDLLARERPDDGVLSEESGVRRAPGASTRRWIVDPIDGTSNFVVGHPGWGTHVALEDEGEIVVGVITRPVSGQRWWAVRGGGAHQDDFQSGAGSRRLRVSTTSELSGSRMSVWPPDQGLADLLRRHAVEVPVPGLNDLGRLCRGELDAVIGAGGGVWDHAPAVLLVEEAGGRFRDPQGGRRLDLDTIHYTNGHIDDELYRLLAL